MMDVAAVIIKEREKEKESLRPSILLSGDRRELILSAVKYNDVKALNLLFSKEGLPRTYSIMRKEQLLLFALGTHYENRTDILEWVIGSGMEIQSQDLPLHNIVSSAFYFAAKKGQPSLIHWLLDCSPTWSAEAEKVMLELIEQENIPPINILLNCEVRLPEVPDLIMSKASDELKALLESARLKQELALKSPETETKLQRKRI